MSSKKKLDREVQKLFAELMYNCRRERKSKTKVTIRELAKDLGKTENFISSVENAREYPSIKTFFKYLILLGFDLSSLKRMTICADQIKDKNAIAKDQLVEQIYSLNETQVDFLVEQAKVAEVFDLKPRK